MNILDLHDKISTFCDLTERAATVHEEVLQNYLAPLDIENDKGNRLRCDSIVNTQAHRATIKAEIIDALLTEIHGGLIALSDSMDNDISKRREAEKECPPNDKYIPLPWGETLKNKPEAAQYCEERINTFIQDIQRREDWNMRLQKLDFCAQALGRGYSVDITIKKPETVPERENTICDITEILFPDGPDGAADITEAESRQQITDEIMQDITTLVSVIEGKPDFIKRLHQLKKVAHSLTQDN